MSDPTARDRFLLEARSLSRVVHPNVVGIHTFGEHHGRVFIAMEYVEGLSLADTLRARGTLPVEEALDIARQIAAGLGEAHALGIIHRDIKPGNVLLRRMASGAPLAKVVDFGLAQRGRARDTMGLTDEDEVLGTPAYMAPEQVRGDPLDGRCDLYALGIVLWQMLTGHVPWTMREPSQLLSAKLSQPAPPMPLRDDGDVTWPEPVEALIQALLSRDPQGRPANAAAFIAAVDEILAPRVSREAVTCVSCGDPDAPPGQFCGVCGAAVPMPACPACGTERIGERYACAACGTSLLQPLRRDGPRPARTEDVATVAVVAVRVRDGADGWPADAAVTGLVESCIEREGGRVLALLGDELIGAFGLGGMRDREIEAAADAALAVRVGLQRLQRARGESSTSFGVGVASGVTGSRGVGLAWGAARLAGPVVLSARGAAARSDGAVLVEPRAMRELRGRYVATAGPDEHFALERKADLLRDAADALHGVPIPFFSRDNDLKRLQLGLVQAQRGVLSCVAATGPTSVGKSRLVAEFLRGVGDQVTVAAGACSAAGIPAPFDPFVQLVRRLLEGKQPDKDAFRGLLEAGGDSDTARCERRADALARLFGGTEQLLAAQTAKAAGVAEQQAAFEAFSALLAGLTRGGRPLVLLLEDLQWARAPTMGLLQHVVRSLAEHPVLLVVTARVDKDPTLIASLPVRRGRLERVALKPLSRRQTASFVAQALDGFELPEPLLVAVDAFARGVPGLVEEALDALIADGVVLRDDAGGWRVDEARAERGAIAPFAELVRSRIGRLPPADRSLLQAVATAGEGAPLDMIGEMVERMIDPREIDALVQAGHLAEVDAPRFQGQREVRYRSPMIAEVLREGLPTRLRQTLHEGAARWLLRWRGPRPAGFGALIAHHYMVAGDRENAVHYLVRTAEEALRAFANLDAWDAYQAALAVALDESEGERMPDDQDALVQARLGLASVGLGIGELDEAARVVEDSVRAMRRARRWSDYVRFVTLKGQLLMRRGDAEAAQATLREAMMMVERRDLDDALATIAGSHYTMALERARDDQNALRSAQRVLSKASDGEHVDDEHVAFARAEMMCGHIHSRAGDFDDARSAYGRARQHFRVAGDETGETMADIAFGNVAYRSGDLDDAEARYREAFEACTARDHAGGAGMALTNLGHVELDRGRLAPAIEALDRAAEIQRKLDDVVLLLETLRLKASAAVQGRHAGLAAAAIKEARALIERLGGRHRSKDAFDKLEEQTRAVDEAAFAEPHSGPVTAPVSRPVKVQRDRSGAHEARFSAGRRAPSSAARVAIDEQETVALDGEIRRGAMAAAATPDDGPTALDDETAALSEDDRQAAIRAAAAAAGVGDEETAVLDEGARQAALRAERDGPAGDERR
jgi:tetratricopeptide (TPR) repeat protein